VADEVNAKELEIEAREQESDGNRAFACDRCGAPMVQSNCKLICQNCGNQFDCSDLNIYFD
jgi:hypothetical protein